MELRPQYDYFSMHDGAQALVYTVGADGKRNERGELTEMNLTIEWAVETVNRMGQEFGPATKPTIRTATASITGRVSQDQSEWVRLAIGNPRGARRRGRVERFNILSWLYDRMNEEAGTQKIIANNCWISNLTSPLVAVDTRILTFSGTIQIEDIIMPERFSQLPTGIIN
jgi:hypothetical protein